VPGGRRSSHDGPIRRLVPDSRRLKSVHERTQKRRRNGSAQPAERTRGPWGGQSERPRLRPEYNFHPARRSRRILLPKADRRDPESLRLLHNCKRSNMIVLLKSKAFTRVLQNGSAYELVRLRRGRRTVGPSTRRTIGSSGEIPGATVGAQTVGRRVPERGVKTVRARSSGYARGPVGGKSSSQYSCWGASAGPS